ncbi:ABC transporter ATP-binding protein [Mycolicibacterium murale]|jgi:zinc/manganese transport system ATP-binding protein|uniref:ABC transporter ATP-binding protein n=1 Tax=Mycolicibacterium murale TaxID=182220 RepID=A0A7I9WYQ8_9MYCO|nr:zinc ABC transporter ATP-binding protein AztA [Mycolicibacterium murale]GFG62337.1 ABC transporter ATP-binding protein [Mycolicibacterium murale]
MNTTPISFESVSFGYGAAPVLSDFSLDIVAGSATTLLGHNGSGKSTVLGLLAGVLRPQAGRVHRNADVALAPQHSKVSDVFPITVAEAVMMGRWGKLGLLRRPTAEDRQIVDHWIATLDLGHLRRRRIGELSGGQRQRTLVAQAFAQQAPIVALDEPTTGVDDESKAKVLEGIRELIAAGSTVVAATHDLDLARQCECCIRLDRGVIVPSGLP